MAIFNTGSVAEKVGNILGWDNLTAISGTTLVDMASQEVNYIETFTSEAISDNSISERFQPAAIDLTMSKALISMDAQAGGISDVKLGDLSVKGGNSSNAELSKQLRIDATARLRELQRSVRWKRVIGC